MIIESGNVFKRLTSFVVLVIFSLLYSAFSASPLDDDPRLSRLYSALDYYNTHYPQQKVYLQLDKTFYNSGEYIWFKAYTLNAIDHTPDKLSTNLYVELINAKQSIVQTLRLKLVKGTAHGEMFLSDTITEGLYQIRAYTNWMKNFDSDYFFTENISVFNPNEKFLISKKVAVKNKNTIEKINDENDKIDLSFMPEGGYLVNGLESVVAFKAIDKNGKIADVQGDVYDSKDNRVASFVSFHDGMGAFKLTPEKTEKYYAVLSSPEKIQKKFELPETLNHGIVMHVENSQNNYLTVDFQTNWLPSSDRYANEIILVGQVRGKIYYSFIVNPDNNNEKIRINKSLFPSGILQLTALSSRLEPLNERLIFINHNDQLTINLNTISNSNQVNFKIRVTDHFDNAYTGNFSITVLDENLLENKTYNKNILSDLLLYSDIKGYINNPSYYFTNITAETEQALDYLMLTQGWRRFLWREVANKDYPAIRYPIENKITVPGRITREFFDISYKDATVTMTILNQYNDQFETQSGEKGFFAFDGLEYYDTVDVRINVTKRNNKRRNLLIVVGNPPADKIVKYQGDQFYTTTSERDNKAYRIARYNEYNKEQEEIKAEQDENFLGSLHNTPDNVLYSKDIPQTATNVFDAIQGRVPGVQVTGDKVLIRGPSSFLGSNEPLYLLDNIPIADRNAVKSIPISDIERIEFLKGPSAAIYGIRGANGVIAIYTKRGRFMKKGVIEFQMLGYHTPRQFYQPKFNSSENQNSGEIKYATVFWEPDLLTSEDGVTNITFNKSPKTKLLRVIVEGISPDGKIGSINQVIEVH
ncbi:MAG: TonB-dependent receptor plug domain-containing protein [Bacteroidales bacterium]|nr:TonB-dependent receptor plug domain-containing protein [Bacteroidales bacterium]